MARVLTPNYVLATLRSDSGRLMVAGEVTNYATTWNFFKGDAEFAKTPWAKLTRSGLGTRIDEAGNVAYGPHNLLLNSATLATQNVTTTAQQYTLKFSGAGTVTISGTATGILSAGTHSITATAGALTLTVSGAVTEAQLNVGALTAYVPTTATPRYLPRITYDPVTHAAQGLLVEGQGVNLATTTGAPQNYTNGASVLTANAAVGIDGVQTNAARFSGAGSDLYKLFASGVSAAHTLSCFYKPEAGNRYFMLSFGAPSSQAAIFDTLTTSVVSVNGGLSARIDAPTAAGYYRLSISGVPAAGALYFQGCPVSSATWSARTTGGYLDGVQAETGTSPTSYIPNSGTGTALRVADDWYLSGSDFAAAFDPTVGTLVVDFNKPAQEAAPKGLLTIGVDGTLVSRIYISLEGGGVWANNGGSWVSVGSYTAGITQRIALSWQVGGNVSFSLNGGAVVSASCVYNGTANKFMFGRIDTAGTYQNPRLLINAAKSYRSQYITGAALQALTA